MRMLPFRRHTERPRPADASAEQRPEAPGPDLTDLAQRADALARVDTSHLDSPYTNPEVVEHQIAARNALHREQIDLDHQRRLTEHRHGHARLTARIEEEDRWRRAKAERETRAIGEACADADEAADELRALRDFDRAASPASAAHGLSTAGPRWYRRFLGLSLAGSVGSAVGIAALALSSQATAGLTGAIPTGVIAELLLTVPVVLVLGFRAFLDHHLTVSTATLGQTANNILNALWILVLACCTGSVIINLVGLFAFATGIYGVIGVVGAIAALCFALTAWGVSILINTAIRANVRRFHGEDAAELRERTQQRAAGVHIPTGSTTEDPVQAEALATQDRPDTQALAAEIADAAMQQLTRYWIYGTKAHGIQPEAALDPRAVAELDTQLKPVLDENAADPGTGDGHRDGEGSGGTAVLDPTPEQAPDPTEEESAMPASSQIHHPDVHSATSGDAAQSKRAVDHLEAHRRQRIARSRERIAEAIAELREQGITEPTPQQVRKHTRMHPDTIHRHWHTVTGQHPPNQGGDQ